MEQYSLTNSFLFGAGRIFFKDGWFRVDAPVSKIVVDDKKVMIEARDSEFSGRPDIIPLYPDMIEFCQSLGDLNFGASHCRMRNTDHSVIFEIVAGSFEKYNIPPEHVAETSESFVTGRETLRSRCGHCPQHGLPQHIRFGLPPIQGDRLLYPGEQEEKNNNSSHSHSNSNSDYRLATPTGYSFDRSFGSMPSPLRADYSTESLSPPPRPPPLVLPPNPQYMPILAVSPVLRRRSTLTNPIDYMGDPVLVTARSAEECTICKSTYECGEQKRWLPCMHSFHAGCIDQWVTMDREEVASCPICKASLGELGDLAARAHAHAYA